MLNKIILGFVLATSINASEIPVELVKIVEANGSTVSDANRSLGLTIERALKTMEAYKQTPLKIRKFVCTGGAKGSDLYYDVEYRCKAEIIFKNSL
jgi:hypothetical protein